MAAKRPDVGRQNHRFVRPAPVSALAGAMQSCETFRRDLRSRNSKEAPNAKLQPKGLEIPWLESTRSPRSVGTVPPHAAPLPLGEGRESKEERFSWMRMANYLLILHLHLIRSAPGQKVEAKPVASCHRERGQGRAAMRGREVACLPSSVGSPLGRSRGLAP